MFQRLVLATALAGFVPGQSSGEPPAGPGQVNNGNGEATSAAVTASPGGPRFEKLPNGDLRLDGITVHKQEHELSFSAAINMTDGPLEVLIATPRGRLHESLLVSRISPLKLQTMLYLLGLQNGPRLPAGTSGRQGDILDILLEWSDQAGKTIREPVEAWVIDARTGKVMQKTGWVFTGSTVREGIFLAEAEGNLVLTYSAGATVLDTADEEGMFDTLFSVNTEKCESVDVRDFTVILRKREKKQ